MNRQEAVNCLYRAERPRRPPALATELTEQHQQFLDNLEALGLIQFDKPPPLLVTCDCDVGDHCPQGRVGHSERCKIVVSRRVK